MLEKRFKRSWFVWLGLFLGSLILLLGSSCYKMGMFLSSGEACDTTKFFESVKPSKAFRIIQKHENDSMFVILDIRLPEDYANSHIANAVNIPFRSKDFSTKINQLNKNQIYLVYCYGGFTSKKTMDLMIEQGFKKVYNLKGGMMQWKAKKFPVK